MISKHEYLEFKNKIANYTLARLEFEKTETYQKWHVWNTLDQEKKEALLKQWDEYYELCRNSFYGYMFKMYNLAVEEHQYLTPIPPEPQEFCSCCSPTINKYIQKLDIRPLIVKLVKNAHVKPLQQPSSIDPRILEREMTPYFHMLAAQMKAEQFVQEYKPIYDPKSATV